MKMGFLYLKQLFLFVTNDCEDTEGVKKLLGFF